MACNWLACLSVILWTGICVLVLIRKEVMMSVLWLRYTGEGALMIRPGEVGDRHLSVCLSQVPVCGQLVLSDSASLGRCFHLGGG